MTTDGRDEGESFDSRLSGAADGVARGSTNAAELVPHPSCGLLVPANWITLASPHERRDPRPGPRASRTAGVGGRLKDRPEDFIVEEIPAYDPCGEGEHLYLGVQKTNMPHTEMLAVISRHFKVDESAIGFAGMKDRVAVTLQTVSVHLPGERPAGELRHERLEVLWARRHGNKLKRGHLRGNRFTLRVVGARAGAALDATTMLSEVRRRGLPNAFGPQRFGRDGTNAARGAELLRGGKARGLDAGQLRPHLLRAGRPRAEPLKVSPVADPEHDRDVERVEPPVGQALVEFLDAVVDVRPDPVLFRRFGREGRHGGRKEWRWRRAARRNGPSGRGPSAGHATSPSSRSRRQSGRPRT